MRGCGRAVLGAMQDVELLLASGETHTHRDREPVKLRVWKGEGPVALGEILCGDNEKGPREIVDISVGGHLPLSHRFEQSRLRSRPGPVYLVGQYDIGEYRTGDELEAFGLQIEHRRSGDVGG